MMLPHILGNYHWLSLNCCLLNRGESKNEVIHNFVCLTPGFKYKFCLKSEKEFKIDENSDS